MPTTSHDSYDIPEVLDRREGPHGEVVLRRHGALLQIIANGCFLMDTSDGRSERRLVDAAADAAHRVRRAGAPHLLIGGLGVGFSLAPRGRRPPLGAGSRSSSASAPSSTGTGADRWRARPRAALADPRTKIVGADLLEYVNETSDTYDALCLDIDNGPGWTVTEGNDGLYAPAGLAGCARLLRPGGVLAVWSAQPSPEFEETLRNAGFQQVRTEEIPVARGVPDVVHLGVGPG